MSEIPTRRGPAAALTASSTPSRSDQDPEAIARRAIRTAAILGAGLAGLITVAIGFGAVAALFASERNAFRSALAVSAVVALLGGVLSGPLLQRLISGAQATTPGYAADPPVPAEGTRGGR